MSLRDLRQRAGKTIQDIADATGLQPLAIQGIEDGLGVPDARAVDAYAQAIGITQTKAWISLPSNGLVIHRRAHEAHLAAMREAHERHVAALLKALIAELQAVNEDLRRQMAALTGR